MGPHYSFTDYVEMVLRFSVPYAFMAALLIVNLVAVPYPLSVLLKAPFLLICLFYWSVYRPTLLPPLLVFFIGIVLDLLSGTPIGMNAVLLIVSRIALVNQRRFLMGQGFVMTWIGFGILNLGYHFLLWSLFVLLNGSWMPIESSASPMLLGLALFPVVYVALHFTHKILPELKNTSRTSLGSQRQNVPL